MLKKIILFSIFMFYITFEAYSDSLFGNNLYMFRDSVDSLVIDKKTSLMWQDDEDSKHVSMNFSTAKQYCDEKILGDYTDWRLPSVNELLSLVDRHRSAPALFLIFKYGVRDIYWTSVLAEQNKVNAISFNDGDIHLLSRNDKKFVRCVRNASKVEVNERRRLNL